MVAVPPFAMLKGSVRAVWKCDGENVCQVPPKLLDAFVNESLPEKVLLSPRSVEEAAPASDVRYPLLFVHWEIFGEANDDVVRPSDDVAMLDT